MTTLPSFSYEISDEEFFLLANLIYRLTGIRLGEHKKTLLVSRLSKRLHKTEVRSFLEYYRWVKDDEVEREEMLNRISTNTTNFFREIHHFKYLSASVIPELLEIKKHERTLRLWSCGCSTGEEPYTLAMAVAEAFRRNGIDMGKWDVKLLASDLSTRVLREAEKGAYDARYVLNDVPDEFLSKYFSPGSNGSAGRFVIKDSLKEMIRFRFLNLKEEEYPFSRDFDIIFCRNVLIYFDEEMKSHVMDRFLRHLALHGYLFLGHSETVHDRTKLSPVFITVFRKAGKGN